MVLNSYFKSYVLSQISINTLKQKIFRSYIYDSSVTPDEGTYIPLLIGLILSISTILIFLIK